MATCEKFLKLSELNQKTLRQEIVRPANRRTVIACLHVGSAPLYRPHSLLPPPNRGQTRLVVVTYVWIGLAVVVVLIVLAYNSLAQLRNLVANAWADIDVYLKRRADLIPNLVETTKAYSGFERDTLESVTQARSEALSAGANPTVRAAAENRLANRVHQIIAIAEQYPELKASSQYLRLQQELSEAEDKISYARQYYNAAVRDMNTTIDRFPQNIVAGIFGFKRGEFFSLDEPEQRETPRADMGQ